MVFYFAKNCWDYSNCNKSGQCPVSTTDKLTGVNNGKKGGRCCWAVAGTFCGGEVQGVFAQKILNCLNCDFFKAVKKQEGINYVSSTEILFLMK